MQFLSADVNSDSPFITHGALDLEMSRNQVHGEKERLTTSLGQYPDPGDLLRWRACTADTEHMYCQHRTISINIHVPVHGITTSVVKPRSRNITFLRL